MGNIIYKGRRNYDEVARTELNATHSRIYFITKKEYGVVRGQQPFSTHYFNSEDKEVGYVNEYMVDLCGLTTFETPRVWSDDLKVHRDYGKPCSLLTHTTTNCGYVGENKNNYIN